MDAAMERVAPAGLAGVVPRSGTRGAAPGSATRDRLLVWASFAAVYVVWGSTFLAIAVAVETIPPLLMVALRSLPAGAVLYVAARLGGAPRPDARAWVSAARVGVLFFLTGQAMLAWGETRVASGAAAVVFATEPLFIVLLGWMGGRMIGRPRGHRPSARVLVSVVLGLLGVAAMSAPGTGSLDVLGLGALLVASLSWSVGTFWVPRDHPARAAGMQLLAGGVLLLVVSALTGELAGFQPGAVSGRSLLALLHLIVFGSIVTFSAYVWLVQRVGAAKVASHTYVNPAVAIALGAWLGGEVFGVRVVVASLIVLAAVFLLVQGSRRAADQA